MKAKRKTKRKAKSARRAKPSQVQRTLVRLEKVMAAQALRIDVHDELAASAQDKLKRIEAFLGRHLAVFHEEQSDTPETVAAKARQARDVMSKAAGALVDPE